MKALKGDNPHVYTTYSQGKPFFRLLPRVLEDSQSIDVYFDHVDKRFKRRVILQENIYATRVVTLSPEELGTMSENNLRVREDDHCFLLERYHLEGGPLER